MESNDKRLIAEGKKIDKAIKRIHELGISPWPWRYIGYHNHKNGEYIHLGEVKFADGRKLCYDIPQPNARIIAAAPELYDVCFRVMRWEDHCKAHNKAIEPWIDIINDMRAALAKAAGESEANNG